ncbi:MAG: helix-turn-helix transcriptional regulator [Proteobacteria bacterium]|nr:helix-turn-helix transcriptional regulator [Pseudomonadota bacterium]MDA0982847.1 helix-turn-helix transcriptional regulator [Pseudomonadota bacterium]
MAKSTARVEALKHELRARKLTHADVAKHTAMSEASIKRLFANGEFTLARVDKVCELLGVEFSEITRSVASPEAVISRLSEEQEKQLVEDPKLMLVALCALAQIPLERILRDYDIPETDGIRLLTSRAFSWIPDGPIEGLFKQQLSQDFFRANLGGEHEMLVLVNGTPSKASVVNLLSRLKRVASDFAKMHIDKARFAAVRSVLTHARERGDLDIVTAGELAAQILA